LNPAVHLRRSSCAAVPSVHDETLWRNSEADASVLVACHAAQANSTLFLGCDDRRTGTTADPSGTADSGVTDWGVTDPGAPDSAVTDSAVTDSGVTDSGVTDSGGPKFGRESVSGQTRTRAWVDDKTILSGGTEEASCLGRQPQGVVLPTRRPFGTPSDYYDNRASTDGRLDTHHPEWYARR